MKSKTSYTNGSKNDTSYSPNSKNTTNFGLTPKVTTPTTAIVKDDTAYGNFTGDIYDASETYDQDDWYNGKDPSIVDKHSNNYATITKTKTAFAPESKLATSFATTAKNTSSYSKTNKTLTSFIASAKDDTDYTSTASDGLGIQLDSTTVTLDSMLVYLHGYLTATPPNQLSLKPTTEYEEL